MSESVNQAVETVSRATSRTLTYLLTYLLSYLLTYLLTYLLPHLWAEGRRATHHLGEALRPRTHQYHGDRVDGRLDVVVVK